MICNRGAFTAVELIVVVVIIGLLAALAVPQCLSSVERSKATEAFNYLSDVRAAQERYHSLHGAYAARLTNLDISLPAPEFYSVGAIQAGRTAKLTDSWQLTLTRYGEAGGFGNYTVTFNEAGFDPDHSTIADMNDINPARM